MPCGSSEGRPYVRRRASDDEETEDRLLRSRRAVDGLEQQTTRIEHRFSLVSGKRARNKGVCAANKSTYPTPEPAGEFSALANTHTQIHGFRTKILNHQRSRMRSHLGDSRRYYLRDVPFRFPLGSLWALLGSDASERLTKSTFSSVVSTFINRSPCLLIHFSPCVSDFVKS